MTDKKDAFELSTPISMESNLVINENKTIRSKLRTGRKFEHLAILELR